MDRFCFIISLFFVIGCSTFLQGQTQFFLNGNAIENSDSCYQLTSAVNWEVGSIWNEKKVDLNRSFKVGVDLFLGCNDELGADGIVFGLQPVSTSIGTAGGDLGFGAVEPSLGVEFDTHENVDYGDPAFDHIAIIRDGELKHNTPSGALAGPVPANGNFPNIEDCQYHPMQILWDVDLQTLSVYLDCQLRLSYTGDIVNEIFNGDPFVFWGFTSATGGLNNVHEVCFSYTTFLDGLVDQTICPGTDIQLEASGGVSYQWSPAEGLSDPNIANPVAAPLETTLYSVEILDDCGIAFNEQVLITVENDQFEVEIENALSNPTEIFSGTELSLSVNVMPDDGEQYTYSWSSAIGSSFSDPDSSNTLVTSSVNQIGTETITVQVMSEDGCIGTDSISIEILGANYDIPNVFTPDGDNINDSFGVVTEAVIAAYHCKVFNRWGQLVFETSDPSEFWDGAYKGKAAPSDVYVYLINLEVGGSQFVERGDLTLIR